METRLATLTKEELVLLVLRLGDVSFLTNRQLVETASNYTNEIANRKLAQVKSYFSSLFPSHSQQINQIQKITYSVIGFPDFVLDIIDTRGNVHIIANQTNLICWCNTLKEPLYNGDSEEDEDEFESFVRKRITYGYENYPKYKKFLELGVFLMGKKKIRNQIVTYFDGFPLQETFEAFLIQ